MRNCGRSGTANSSKINLPPGLPQRAGAAESDYYDWSDAAPPGPPTEKTVAAEEKTAEEKDTAEEKTAAKTAAAQRTQQRRLRSHMQRYEFIRHSAVWGKKRAVIPKRLTLLALQVGVHPALGGVGPRTGIPRTV